MIAPVNGVSLGDIEVQLLLEAVFRYTGYDFRDYAPATLKRRVSERVRGEAVETVSGLQEKVLHDGAAMERFVYGLSVNSSSLFRDPEFFRALRERVVPLLRTYPYVRIWNAGCGLGEEAYSIAIVLHEEGILHRCKIYATEVSETAVSAAKAGEFSLKGADDPVAQYAASGGKGSLSDFYTMSKERVVFAPELKSNLIVAQHNMVSDGSFNEFNLIVCRNVISMFNKGLQYRVHNLLLESLSRGGILGLGYRETLKYTPHERAFEDFEPEQRLYRRVR